MYGEVALGLPLWIVHPRFESARLPLEGRKPDMVESPNGAAHTVERDRMLVHIDTTTVVHHSEQHEPARPLSPRTLGRHSPRSSVEAVAREVIPGIFI